MKLHETNCGTMCPLGGRWFTGDGPVALRGKMVARVLVAETRAGIVLIDTGLGTEDSKRLPSAYRLVTGPTLDPTETAVARLRALGLDPNDVTHIVLTHLDLDHAGGISDFPRAQIHVHDRELDAALAQATAAERRRYLPSQWAHGPRWVRHREDGETWKGLASVRAIHAVDDELLLVPMHGHTRGHTAVAVRAGDRWIVHAGDAYFHRGELLDPPRCPRALRLFQSASCFDDRARRANQARLRELAKAPDVKLVCSHDPEESIA